jgi:6-phosphogluconate dehydrogenase
MNAGFDIGMVGLGVMGRNLLLNMADHGYSVAGLDTDASKVQALKSEGAGKKVDATTQSRDFVSMLRPPRPVVLLVPAGRAVDAVIQELLPLLSPGDLIIDSGNSHFSDTERRSRELQDKKVHFFGMGVSGGEAGARHGPSMMPGGPREAYERVRPILEAIAAKIHGEPCVAYLGPGSCGHFVKMVHNGIEYGLMQLIAETYELMKRGLGMSNDELHSVYKGWNQGPLSSYLLEITAAIFLQVDPKTGNRLVDMILDVGRQKGTGKWTSQEAMELQVPITIIDAAVSMRDMSAYESERKEAANLLAAPDARFTGDRQVFLKQLEEAFHAAMIITYSQGMAMLCKASSAKQFNLDLETVARIWRGGCIIRAALLEDLRAAYKTQPGLANPLLDRKLAQTVSARHQALRSVVRTGAELGLGVPGFMASLSYYDSYRNPRLPTNLIQAQRDFFGAHTYERIDEKGTFHTKWGS